MSGYQEEPEGYFIKFSIFHVSKDFVCSLVSEVKIEAGDVSVGGLDDKFTASESAANTYLCVWSDLSNDQPFSLASLVVDSQGESVQTGDVTIVRISPKDLPLGFFELPDVYFINDSLYTSRVYPAGPTHPQHLVMQVWHTGITLRSARRLEFQRCVALPLEYDALTSCSHGEEFVSQVLQYKPVSDYEGKSERFLVKVSLQKTCVERMDTCVVLLLQAPTNQVLDMAVTDDPYESAFCIHSDNRSVARVVHTQGKITFWDYNPFMKGLLSSMEEPRERAEPAPAKLQGSEAVEE